MQETIAGEPWPWSWTDELLVSLSLTEAAAVNNPATTGYLDPGSVTDIIFIPECFDCCLVLRGHCELGDKTLDAIGLRTNKLNLSYGTLSCIHSSPLWPRSPSVPSDLGRRQKELWCWSP